MVHLARARRQRLSHSFANVLPMAKKFLLARHPTRRSIICSNDLSQKASVRFDLAIPRGLPNRCENIRLMDWRNITKMLRSFVTCGGKQRIFFVKPTDGREALQLEVKNRNCVEMPNECSPMRSYSNDKRLNRFSIEPTCSARRQHSTKRCLAIVGFKRPSSMRPVKQRNPVAGSR